VIEIFASGDEGDEETCGGRCGHDRREREIIEVEIGERVAQGVEHLSTQLQVLVMASATTGFEFHIAPRHGQTVPIKVSQSDELR
jgi:hypothetical protein